MKDGFKTAPVKQLFGRAERVVRRRIRRDGERAPAMLRPLFEHLAERFYDVDLNLADLERRRVVHTSLRERFRAAMGMPVKRYLLELKMELAGWLLAKTHLQVRHVAYLLGYSRDYNFSRDFGRCKGMSPVEYRLAQGKTSQSRRRSDRAATTRGRLLLRIGCELPQSTVTDLPPGALAVVRGEACSEVTAQLVWDAVRQEAPGRHRQLLQQEAFFTGPELFELLSRRSREEGRQHLQRGVTLARLAVVTAETSALLPQTDGGARVALALARLGNAQRLASDFAAANHTFDQAWAAWARLEEWAKDRRVEAEMLDLEASLRLFERRYVETLELLERSLALSRSLADTKLQARSLLQRIALNGYRGRPQEMLPDLEDVRALLEAQTEVDRFLLLGVFQEYALALFETGRVNMARHALARAQAFNEVLDHRPSRYQQQWIAGLLALEQSDEATAEQCFRQARVGFEELGDRLAAALAALELAILCHQQGRYGEVLVLTTSAVLPVLVELRLDGEALATRQLLLAASAANIVPLRLLEQTRQVLHQRRRDPTVAKER